MILSVIASGSKANAYVIDNGKHRLILECGVSLKELKKAIDFELHTVAGCLLSHSHQDHSKYAKEIVGAGIYLYSSRETLLDSNVSTSTFALACMPLKPFRVGSYQITPFEVEHDVTDPYGYIIIDEVSKERILFATDTHMLRYKFKGIDHYLIECNYDDDTIIQNYEKGLLDEFRYNRIKESHMSLKTLVEAIKSHNSTPKTITLLHLSDSNSNEQRIIETITNEFGIMPRIANAGLSIGL